MRCTGQTFPVVAFLGVRLREQTAYIDMFFVFFGLLPCSFRGDHSTFLVALPNYLGIFLVYAVGGRAFRLLDRLGVWEARRRALQEPTLNRVHHSLYVVPTENEKRLAASRPFPIGFLTRLFHPERRKLFVLAFNELGGFLTGITGLSIAGSGLYQVVFSGGTVFTALLSVFFLRKSLACSQWFFVGLITVGLLITAEQVTHTLEGDEAHAANIISGVVFVLVSCLFYATNYVIAEHFLDENDMALESPANNAGSFADLGDDLSGSAVEAETFPLHRAESHIEDPPELPPPSSLDLSLYTGGSCLVVFGVYVLCHTVPNWNRLVTSSIERHHGNYFLIAEQYFYLCLAAFLHAISHYDIVATVGAVPVGVLNAVRAVSVFGMSSILFCEHQASQCYTTRKGASTAIVVVGAVGYSVASAAVSRRASRGSTILPTERQQKRRSKMIEKSAPLERSASVPFLDDAMKLSTAGSSWFSFGKRR